MHGTRSYVPQSVGCKEIALSSLSFFCLYVCSAHFSATTLLLFHSDVAELGNCGTHQSPSSDVSGYGHALVLKPSFGNVCLLYWQVFMILKCTLQLLNCACVCALTYCVLKTKQCGWVCTIHFEVVSLWIICGLMWLRSFNLCPDGMKGL